MSEFFNEKIEISSIDEIRSLQEDRLKKIVRYVYDRNKTVKKKIDAEGFAPDDIRSLDDIVKIPFVSKEDLRISYPLVLSCVDKKEIVEMHMSSGSTGTPVVMPYTRGDIRQWGECMARCYKMAGVREGDVLQITPSFGLFNGGFGFYHGAQELGLFVIPTGAGNTPRQIKLAKDFKTRALTGVVSYGIRIMEVLEEEKLELPDLEIGIFGAETFSESLKKKISSGLGVEVFDIYGHDRNRWCRKLWVWIAKPMMASIFGKDHYIVEIINPDTGEQLPDGKTGELVITSLTREAMPLFTFPHRRSYPHPKPGKMCLRPDPSAP